MLVELNGGRHGPKPERIHIPRHSSIHSCEECRDLFDMKLLKACWWQHPGSAKLVEEGRHAWPKDDSQGFPFGSRVF